MKLNSKDANNDHVDNKKKEEKQKTKEEIVKEKLEELRKINPFIYQ